MSHQDAIKKLNHAQADIDAAIALLSSEPEPPDPEPPDGDSINVYPGDDLVALIEEYPEGTCFAIDPTFTASLGDRWIPKGCTLQTAGPLPDGRVGVSHVGPQLYGSLKFPAGMTCIGIRFEGINASTVITAGNGTTLDRCVILGPPNRQQHRGVAANAEDITIIRCHIGNIYKDQDTQAVSCWEKTKRLKILDCYLEASGENFMAGGSDSQTAAEMPEDILIEDCHMFKPVEWIHLDGCATKNLFELKACKRVAVRRCLMEFNWADAQSGNCLVLSVRNQNGAAVWSTIQDVLIEDVTIKHVGGGISILGRDDNYDSTVASNITLRRITIEDLSKSWNDGKAMATGNNLMISGGPDRLTIEDCNLAINPGSVNAAVAFDQIEHPITNLVIRNCKFHEGNYGMIGEAPGATGVDQITGHAPGYVWEGVTIQRGNSGRNINYPPGTTVLPPVSRRR